MTRKMTIRKGLEKMLEIAQARLRSAKEKDKRWDISHYRKDIRIIKTQLYQLPNR